MHSYRLRCVKRPENYIDYESVLSWLIGVWTMRLRVMAAKAGPEYERHNSVH